jgi:predicted ester cyclase
LHRNEEFWNKGNLAAADELIGASAAIVLPGRGQVSLDDFKALAASLRGAFPDWYATTEELVAEEDRIAERWTGWGTHRGEVQGIAPTGRQLTVLGTVFYRLASGKITEFRRQFDGLALMQQLGAVPDHQEIAPAAKAGHRCKHEG